MQQDEDDEAVYQQVFGQPAQESFHEDFSPDDDHDEEFSASIQQAQLKPNSRRKLEQRVSLMDKRYQMDPIVDNAKEEEKNMYDNEEGKSDYINDENRYSSKRSPQAFKRN